MPDKSRTIGRKSANLPVTGLHDWLPERMLACIIVGIVERLDLSGLIRGSGTTHSEQAVDPAKLLALLFFGYTSGVFSSRDLEKATYQSDVYRFVTANTHPHHLVIAAFRKCFTHDIERLFVRILGISYMMKQANLGGPRLDRKQLEKQLHREASELLKCAETADAEIRNAGGPERKFARNAAIKTRAGRTDSSPGVRTPPHAERVSAQLPPGNAADSATQTSAPEQLDRIPQKQLRTYTFLSRKRAVMALASDVSKSIVAPLFGGKRSAMSGTRKRRINSPDTHQPRPGDARAGAIAILLVAGLTTSVFMLAQYVDRRDPSGPVHASLSAGSIQRETGAETSVQTEIAALTDTVLLRADSAPDADSQLTSESEHLLPPLPDAPALPEPYAEIAGMDSAPAPENKPVQPDEHPLEQAMQPAPPEVDTVQRENWLLDQPPGNYMLQLSWDREQAGLQKFIEQHRLQGPIAYYKDQKNDKDRYVLVYGNYSTRHAALADLETLPEPVRNNGPWPRKISSIQGIILRQKDAPLR